MNLLFNLKYQTMWNCKNCGTSLDDSMSQCPSCGYNSMTNSIIKSKPSNYSSGNSPEDVLEKVAKVILAIGIICSFILVVAGCIYCNSYQEMEKQMGIYMLIGIIPVLIPSIATWALFNVISNISLKLRR